MLEYYKENEKWQYGIISLIEAILLSLMDLRQSVQKLILEFLIFEYQPSEFRKFLCFIFITLLGYHFRGQSFAGISLLLHISHVVSFDRRKHFLSNFEKCFFNLKAKIRLKSISFSQLKDTYFHYNILIYIYSSNTGLKNNFNFSQITWK